MGLLDSRIDRWCSFMKNFKSLPVGHNGTRIELSPESQLVVLPLEGNIPPASWISFPVLLERRPSPLLTPRCTSRVEKLFVLVLLMLLAASLVHSWHLFLLSSYTSGFHAAFPATPLLALFSSAIAILFSLLLFEYASHTYLRRSCLLLPQGLSTDLSLCLALCAHLIFGMTLTLTLATLPTPLRFLFSIAPTLRIILPSLLVCYYVCICLLWWECEPCRGKGLLVCFLFHTSTQHRAWHIVGIVGWWRHSVCPVFSFRSPHSLPRLFGQRMPVSHP